MLDEIPLSETNAVCLTPIGINPIHRNRGNGVILRATAQHTLNSALSASQLINRVWGEGVSPRGLTGNLPGVVQGRELRHGRCCAGLQEGAEEAHVDSLILETLIDASEILRAVPDLGGTERALVNHG